MTRIRGAHLSASLAHVRLLSGVNTHVHRQGGPLNELLTAVGVIAHVGTNTAVYPF